MGGQFRALSAGLALSVAILTTPIHAQTNVCGLFGSPPTIEPKIHPDVAYSQNSQGFSCQMWQAFIYLTWPAHPDRRGDPDPTATFGSLKPTVWETFKTAEQVFLPRGDDPGAWLNAPVNPALDPSVAPLVADGRVRHLTISSKISSDVLANILRQKPLDSKILEAINRIGRSILHDLNGNPVFHEVSVNEDLYKYIQQNGLYNARKQAEYANTSLITLPMGATDFGRTGAVSVKAAWKILSPAEEQSGRFHTAQALVQGKLPLRTVGLVGMHVFQPMFNLRQGAWATFAHVDNAPIRGEPLRGPYSFYDVRCTGCMINDPTSNPTQVMQFFPDDPAAKTVTRYMQDEIRRKNPQAPWQYYKLVAVHWPRAPRDVTQANTPLPTGEPTPVPALNAVLETFDQAAQNSCLTCHSNAAIVALNDSTPPAASYYSFVFGRAKSP
jgi:hypothetical protein